jgi:hypothetical protein
MFDLRYHVASLAAVFVALIVGILVGVGLTGSGVTKKADLRLAQAQRDKAETQRDAAQAQVKELQKTEKAFELAYSDVMRNLLPNKRIAVLFVGPRDGGVNQAIENTLRDADAKPVVRMISLSVPVNPQNLDGVLFDKGSQFVKYAGNDKLESLGNALGSEFATGGQTPLWKALGKQLIGERGGNLRQRIDGIVVVRTVPPQQGDTAHLLKGFYTGMTSAGIPVVGVEKSSMVQCSKATPGTNCSAVSVYGDRGLSSVDDIDLTTGRVALALLLAGAVPGNYGNADDADAILPTLPSG